MKATATDRRRATGFTLIEVLAALVIVALGMLGVIEAVTQTARNGTYMREKTLAHWIAMNVITEPAAGCAARSPNPPTMSNLPAHAGAGRCASPRPRSTAWYAWTCPCARPMPPRTPR
jgi:type II secretion system protein I